MPDISMCKGGNCPMRTWCYRYTAKPSEFMQSYFIEVPHTYSNPVDCDYFWSNEEYEGYEVKELKNGN